MRTITPELVDALVDFAPAEADKGRGFAHLQRDGTVAVFNMLARNRCAYLADEVGMGKTYVALAVMSLLKFQNPHARVIVIAPRENIQRKWEKELRNFVRVNWRVVGNRVKTLRGEPVWEPVVCDSLLHLAAEAMRDQDRDFFLRMTSFSLALADPKRRDALRRNLVGHVPWMREAGISNRSADGFRDSFATALNGAIPSADLVIVDEAHNLKHGFGEHASTRNRVMGVAFGRAGTAVDEAPWFAPRAARLLLLSATPFEDDYAAIARQLDVFGFGDAELRDAAGGSPLPVSLLAARDASVETRRAVLGRMLLRRVSGLMIGGELRTKNMYRREWRRGGLLAHDEPIAVDDPRQRLIIALMQKKVAEVLQSEKFDNQFQIGMLSSFESFLQTVETRRRRSDAGTADETTEDEESRNPFDDSSQNQLATTDERRGIDTDAVAAVARSYRERFGAALPHPKLDAVAAAHASAFQTGEKSLVFVRRVATVSELAAKLEEAFDRWIQRRVCDALPELRTEVDALFARYAAERQPRPEEIGRVSAPQTEADVDDADLTRDLLTEADEGGAETFFAWYFRGEGPPGVLSGAAFQRNRLSAASSAYATLFDDDHVAALVGAEGGAVLDALARTAGVSSADCATRLRELAFAQFAERSQQRDRYPRGYVVESYQIAGLMLLAATDGPLAEHARIILEERFPDRRHEPREPPPGFPTPIDGLGITTVFTELRRHPALRQTLWPEPTARDFRVAFREREQRRELLSAMARLGAAYIDLYLLAIRALGSFAVGQQSEGDDPGSALARAFVALLDRQRAEPGFHAWRELSAAASAFDQVVAVNFPEVPGAELPELARIYAATLQKQVPVGRMAGSVNKRLVRQFRMPGFPLVLVSTDVLQEGEDLHTFCRRVVHYGITWTSSAMEQRTGRVDRIGGLVQREIDGQADEPDASALIQVHYPHLRDTVEVLQVRRVLARVNRFLELMHHTNRPDTGDQSSIDTARAWLDDLDDVPPLRGRLESAFPVRPEWLAGELGAADVGVPDWGAQFAHFRAGWEALVNHKPIQGMPATRDHVRTGALIIAAGDPAGSKPATRTQDLVLELRSQITGDETLLWCKSDVTLADLSDDTAVDALIKRQKALGWVKICVRPRVAKGLDEVRVEGDVVFHPERTEVDEMWALVERTALHADRLRNDAHESTAVPFAEHLAPELESRLDALVAREGLPWKREGRTLEVALNVGARRQRVTFARNARGYVFRSSVLDDARQPRSPAERRALAFRTWCRNALKPIVTFAFDPDDRLVGVIEQPVETMDDTELRQHIETLARECDRYEYILTGGDSE
ncbi:MAG: DEAD/DEAH box helicase family protein [Chromatiales bacterium]|nr:DEAD/DEAH box helicase family protein [Chromatiales bacterium]